MNYEDYLKSDDWKLKVFRKKRKKKRCSICGNRNNLETHHLNYRNLYDVTNKDLCVICHNCHFLGHRLFKEGKIKFINDNPLSRFARFKIAVRKETGTYNINMFRNT